MPSSLQSGWQRVSASASGPYDSQEERLLPPRSASCEMILSDSSFRSADHIASATSYLLRRSRRDREIANLSTPNLTRSAFVAASSERMRTTSSSLRPPSCLSSPQKACCLGEVSRAEMASLIGKRACLLNTEAICARARLRGGFPVVGSRYSVDSRFKKRATSSVEILSAPSLAEGAGAWCCPLIVRRCASSVRR